jgi:serine/threonine-protein kinase
MTRAGTQLGTLSYMSPEQSQGNLELVGQASDQYSAGVVLYELLTQHLPFEGAPRNVLPYVIVNTPPPPPSEWRADLDPRLNAICMQALAKKPADRYASCREFAAVLTAWQTGPRTAPPPPPAKKPPVPVPRPAPATPPRKAPAAARRPPIMDALPAEEPDDLPEPAPTSSRRAWLMVTLLGSAAAIIAGGSYVAYLVVSKPAPARELPSMRGLRDKGKKS